MSDLSPILYHHLYQHQLINMNDVFRVTTECWRHKILCVTPKRIFLSKFSNVSPLC